PLTHTYDEEGLGLALNDRLRRAAGGSLRPLQSSGRELSMPESSSESAQDRRLDQIVVAPLAGQTIGSAETQFIIAECSDPGAPPGPPRPIAPLHVHHEDDEAWYILEGTLAFQLGDQVVEVGAGGVAFAPRGLAHTYWNPRQERARYLLIMTPAIRGLI